MSEYDSTLVMFFVGLIGGFFFGMLGHQLWLEEMAIRKRQKQGISKEDV